MKRILFRVNASAKVGMGHLMRCLTIADHLKDTYGTENVFAVNDFQSGIKSVSQKGYQLIRVGDSLNDAVELDLLREFLNKYSVDLFIVDMNHPSNKCLAFLKQNGKVAHFYDRNVLNTYDVDLVMNHHICLTDTIREDSGKRYLFGPKYFVLAPFFHDKITEDYGKNRVFLNQGGGDPFNLTCKILCAIKSLGESFSLNIVTGAAYKKEYKKELNGILSNYPIPSRIYEDISYSEIFRLMKESCFAITAAGNTLYELSFLGIPSIVISHHDDHDIVAQRFEEKDACVNLGIGSQIKKKLISVSVERFLRNTDKRNTISINAKTLVDGNGLQRVGKALMLL